MTKMGSTVKTKTEISSQGSFDQLRLKADPTSLLKGQFDAGWPHHSLSFESYDFVDFFFSRLLCVVIFKGIVTAMLNITHIRI